MDHKPFSLLEINRHNSLLGSYANLVIFFPQLNLELDIDIHFPCGLCNFRHVTIHNLKQNFSFESVQRSAFSAHKVPLAGYCLGFIDGIIELGGPVSDDSSARDTGPGKMALKVSANGVRRHQWYSHTDAKSIFTPNLTVGASPFVIVIVLTVRCYDAGEEGEKEGKRGI